MTAQPQTMQSDAAVPLGNTNGLFGDFVNLLNDVERGGMSLHAYEDTPQPTQQRISEEAFRGAEYFGALAGDDTYHVNPLDNLLLDDHLEELVEEALTHNYHTTGSLQISLVEIGPGDSGAGRQKILKTIDTINAVAAKLAITFNAEAQRSGKEPLKPGEIGVVEAIGIDASQTFAESFERDVKEQRGIESKGFVENYMSYADKSEGIETIAEPLVVSWGGTTMNQPQKQGMSAEVVCGNAISKLENITQKPATILMTVDMTDDIPTLERSYGSEANEEAVNTIPYKIVTQLKPRIKNGDGKARVMKMDDFRNSLDITPERNGINHGTVVRMGVDLKSGTSEIILSSAFSVNVQPNQALELVHSRKPTNEAFKKMTKVAGLETIESRASKIDNKRMKAKGRMVSLRVA